MTNKTCVHDEVLGECLFDACRVEVLRAALLAEKERAHKAEAERDQFAKAIRLERDMTLKRLEAAESEVSRLKAEKDYDGKEVLAAQVAELTAKLADVSCEFCEDGAKCCEKFDNSYGEMVRPSLTVCTTCWNKAAASTAKLDAAMRVVEAARESYMRNDFVGSNTCFTELSDAISAMVLAEDNAALAALTPLASLDAGKGEP